jgi:hypothetical protein
LAALETLRVSLFGPPNRRKQPERYVQWGLKWFEYTLTKNNMRHIVYINNLSMGRKNHKGVSNEEEQIFCSGNTGYGASIKFCFGWL